MLIAVSTLSAVNIEESFLLAANEASGKSSAVAEEHCQRDFAASSLIMRS
jgi:hypothetical protein